LEQFSKVLNQGIFLVVTEDSSFQNYELIAYSILCDAEGNNYDTNIDYTSKSGKTFNHKITLNDLITSRKELKKHRWPYSLSLPFR